MPSDAEETLACYLEECRLEASASDLPRVRCDTCSASRSIYCFDCYRLFIPRDKWPMPLRDGTLRLPFDVDIVLNDRRSSATGVQLHTIFRAMNDSSETAKECTGGRCHLYDVDEGDVPPDYTRGSDSDGTYLLFPGKGSQPFSSLVSSNGETKIERLVVLDCKWSKSSSQFHPGIVDLPQVHLDHVPKHSYYWRWHNAGEGMLSTIEAVYFSAWQVASIRRDYSTHDRANLVHMLWLFGLQREIIQTKYAQGKVKRYKHETGVPFLEDTKEFQRSLRAKQRLEREQAKEEGKRVDKETHASAAADT